MKYFIEKGDMFLCIKNYIMDDYSTDYIKGNIYTSEIDNCITDDDGDTKHEMSNQDDFFEYFKLLQKITILILI